MKKTLLKISVVKDRNALPDSIQPINKQIYQLDILDLIKKPIVYFLILGEDVMYIGQTVRPFARISDHINESRIPFDKVLFFQSTKNDCKSQEHALIAKYTPPYNGNPIASSRQLNYHLREQDLIELDMLNLYPSCPQ